MTKLNIETAIKDACVELYGNAWHATFNSVRRACAEANMSYAKLVGMNGADLINLKWIGLRSVPAILKGLSDWQGSKSANTGVETVSIPMSHVSKRLATLKAKVQESDSAPLLANIDHEANHSDIEDLDYPKERAVDDTAREAFETLDADEDLETEVFFRDLSADNQKEAATHITEDSSDDEITWLAIEASIATDKGITFSEYREEIREMEEERDRIQEELLNKLHEDAHNNGVSIEEQVDIENAMYRTEEEAYHEDYLRNLDTAQAKIEAKAYSKDEEEAYEIEAERNKLDRDVEEYNDTLPRGKEYLIMLTLGNTVKYYKDLEHGDNGTRLITSLLARHAKTSKEIECIKARAITLRDRLSSKGVRVHIRECDVRNGKVISHK
jgi:hypothetical protein